MTHADEIAEYVAQVRAALADLPAEQREELLEELPEHLAEVAAEGDEPLRSRLGPPDRYAAELRAAIEVEQTGDQPASGSGIVSAVGVAWTSLVTALRPRLRSVDLRLGRFIGYAKVSDFLVLLRPAWWVLRGYLAAMAVVYIVDGGYGSHGLLPRLGGSLVMAIIMLAVFVVGSIWLGRRDNRLGRWPRRAVGAASVLLVLGAFIGFSVTDNRTRNGDFVRFVNDDRYSNVQDVFVYDSNGQLLRGVRLFDQDGNPINLGETWPCPINPDDPGAIVVYPNDNAYPRCPRQDPFTVPRIGQSPFPGAPSAVPSSPAVPSVSAAPSASPTVPSAPAPSPTRSE